MHRSCASKITHYHFIEINKRVSLHNAANNGLFSSQAYIVYFLGFCTFPSDWIGEWFQAGVNFPIKIETNSINFRGDCVEKSGVKYLLKDA